MPRILRAALWSIGNGLVHGQDLDRYFGVAIVLRRQNVALVVADTAGKWPYREDVTADFMYLRLHGDKVIYASGYTDAALARWAVRIRAWSTGSEPADAVRIGGPAAHRRPRDVYCYFDNDIKVKAPFDAQRLRSMLGIAKDPGGAAATASTAEEPSGVPLSVVEVRISPRIADGPVSILSSDR